MKKVLIATTALVCSAGIAAADVKISGYGRTGIDYQEDREIAGEEANSTQIISRLRMNIDASKTTDSNVDFGGRIRMQWDQNNSSRGEAAVLNAGQLWVRSQGLTVTVGNVGSAYDDAELLADSEVGIYDRSFGNASGAFFAYETSPYSEDGTLGGTYRLGISAEYDFGPFATKFSYIDPDQSGTDSSEETFGFEEEYALSVFYEADRFSISAAGVMNGAGIEDNDQFGIGGAYKLRDTVQVGLNYIDNGEDRFIDVNDIDGDGDFFEILEESAGDTIVLYGSFEVAPLTTIEAYVANNDSDGKETDTAFGLGGNYDLGGARLSGAIERGYDEKIRADAGVRFDF